MPYEGSRMAFSNFFLLSSLLSPYLLPQKILNLHTSHTRSILHSCGKTQAQFQGMEVGNSAFTAYIDLFTSNTYIMVILSDSRIHTTTTQINVKAARAAFETFVP